MPSFRSTSIAALAILSGSPFATAIPTTDASLLAIRQAVDFTDCTVEETTRLGKGFNDAVTLSAYAQHIDTTGAAFTHYFRGTGDGKTEDEAHAKAIWAMAARNNEKAAPYKFTVRCEKDKKKSGCGSGSLAITDATPEAGGVHREMLICPKFFSESSKETVNDLDSKPFKKDPKRGEKSWCQPGSKFKDFEVAGHTLLHEMTHLDALGKAAGIPARKSGDVESHGTDDVAGLGKDYVVAARKLTQLWNTNKQTAGTLKPWENAEDIAAAALESFVSIQCGFTDIPL